MRFSLPEPTGARFANAHSLSLAISPDGTRLVFVATSASGGSEQLWLHEMGTAEARPLPGTETTGAAAVPFWSPDGKSIGFGANSKLKRFDLATSAVTRICDLTVEPLQGATWGADGTIVFAGQTQKGLERVSADGSGHPEFVTTVDKARGETGHRQPSFLPDGRHFLFNINAGARKPVLAVGSLDGRMHEYIGPAESRGSFARPGYLLFMLAGRLHAQAFDPDSRHTTGNPIPIADGVDMGSSARAEFTVSSNGVLIYRAGGGDANDRVPAWFDRTEQQLRPIDVRPDYYIGLELFPDDRRLVTQVRDPSVNSNIWLLNLDDHSRTQMTFGDDHDMTAWVADNGRLIRWYRAGAAALFERPSDGTGLDTPLYKPPAAFGIVDWGTRWLVGKIVNSERNVDLWYAETTSPDRRQIYAPIQGGDVDARLSPDERWLLYAPRPTGQACVSPFPDIRGGKWCVPGSNGATNLRWRSDGKELYFNQEKVVSAVAMDFADPPHGLGRLQQYRIDAPLRPGFTTSRDGQRFLVFTRVERPATAPLTVVVNWTGLLPAGPLAGRK